SYARWGAVIVAQPPSRVAIFIVFEVWRNPVETSVRPAEIQAAEHGPWGDRTFPQESHLVRYRPATVLTSCGVRILAAASPRGCQHHRRGRCHYFSGGTTS